MAARLLREVAIAYPEGPMRKEAFTIREPAGAADGQEGVAAFLAKRLPRFAGR